MSQAFAEGRLADGLRERLSSVLMDAHEDTSAFKFCVSGAAGPSA